MVILSGASGGLLLVQCSSRRATHFPSRRARALPACRPTQGIAQQTHTQKALDETHRQNACDESGFIIGMQQRVIISLTMCTKFNNLNIYHIIYTKDIVRDTGVEE